MQDRRAGLWGGAEAYERYMGRWSRRIAPLFLAWLARPAKARWIDIGCGTGVLTSSLLASGDPSGVVGMDSQPGFLQSARIQVSDPRVSFREGLAQSLPEADAGFDVAVSGLVLNFVPDKEAMVREMARVVRPGGMVALYVWDYAGHMQVMRNFFDAATVLDPKAAEFDDGRRAPECRPGPLADLFERCGLRDVAVTALDVPASFDGFEDYWTPFLGGTGSAPKYCMSLDEPARARLRDAVRARLPTGPDGEILLAVRAWAVKGRVA
ncbi:MAG: class I SAM-dependent methyltransferase [Parvibaculaceae bacterium]